MKETRKNCVGCQEEKINPDVSSIGNRRQKTLLTKLNKFQALINPCIQLLL